MHAVATLAPADLTDSAAAAFLDFRRRVTALDTQRTHGSVTYTLDEDGALLELEDVETLQQADGEELDAFLIRIWARSKIDQRAAVTWSQHGGRHSARVTWRRYDDQAASQIAALGQQIGRLTAYIERMQRYGDDSHLLEP